MLALVVIVFSSYTLGMLVLRLLRLRCTFGESLLLSLGAGYGVWSFFLFALGHAGLFSRPFLIGLAVALALPAPLWFWRMWRNREAASCVQTQAGENDGRGRIPAPASMVIVAVLVVVIGAILLVTFIASLAPVTGGVTNDEICTHLSVPLEWLRHGGVVELPWAVSYQAGNAHTLFLLASCFDGVGGLGNGPRLTSWLSFVLCLGGVYLLARTMFGRIGSLFAVTVTAANPLVFRGASVAFVDLQSSLFVVLPLVALLAFTRERRWGWLVLAGFFLGIGVGIKATNVIYAAVILLAGGIGYLVYTRSFAAALRGVLAVGTVAVVCGAPWPVRTLLHTGSPTYPPPMALYEVGDLKPLLGTPMPYTRGEVRAFYDYCLSRYGDYERGFFSFLAFPWDLTMEPERFQVGDSMGALMLSFVPLAFLFWPLPRMACFLLAVSGAGAVVLYFAVLPEARYYIPALMLLAPVAAYAAAKLLGFRVMRGVVVMVVLVNLLFMLAVAMRITAAPILAAVSESASERYRQERIPFYETFEYLRAHSIDTVRVVAPERNFYYLPGAYVIDTIEGAGWPVLELDYSQVLHRAPDARRGFSPLPGHARLLFEGPDARVYEFTEEPSVKGTER